MNNQELKPCPFCVGEAISKLKQKVNKLEQRVDANKKNGRSKDILILNSVEAGGVAVYNAEGHWDVYITDGTT